MLAIMLFNHSITIIVLVTLLAAMSAAEKEGRVCWLCSFQLSIDLCLTSAGVEVLLFVHIYLYLFVLYVASTWRLSKRNYAGGELQSAITGQTDSLTKLHPGAPWQSIVLRWLKSVDEWQPLQFPSGQMLLRSTRHSLVCCHETVVLFGERR